MFFRFWIGVVGLRCLGVLSLEVKWFMLSMSLAANSDQYIY